VDILLTQRLAELERLLGIQAHDIDDEQVAHAVELLLQVVGNQLFQVFAHGSGAVGCQLSAVSQKAGVFSSGRSLIADSR
jgi:hypothetical protein